MLLTVSLVESDITCSECFYLLRCYKNPYVSCVNDQRGPKLDMKISLSIVKNSVIFVHSNWYKINGHNMTGFHMLYIQIIFKCINV